MDQSTERFRMIVVDAIKRLSRVERSNDDDARGKAITINESDYLVNCD